MSNSRQGCVFAILGPTNWSFARGSGSTDCTWWCGGEARLTVRDARGYPLEVARVGRGEFFGEGSVLAELPSEVTVTATSDLQLVVASPSAMYRLIGRSPALSRQLGHVMDSRRKAALSARRVASR